MRRRRMRVFTESVASTLGLFAVTSWLMVFAVTQLGWSFGGRRGRQPLTADDSPVLVVIAFFFTALWLGRILHRYLARRRIEGRS